MVDFIRPNNKDIIILSVWNIISIIGLFLYKGDLGNTIMLVAITILGDYMILKKYKGVENAKGQESQNI